MKAPVVQSISWRAAVVSALPLAVVLPLNWWLWPELFPLAGALGWCAVVLLARQVLTGAHRKGIRRVKQGQFAEAVPLFAESYAAMVRWPWIDRYRSLLLGSASRWSYREMALCNEAFCHGQIGDGRKMRERYAQALAEFPSCVLASSALRMLDAVAADGAALSK